MAGYLDQPCYNHSSSAYDKQELPYFTLTLNEKGATYTQHREAGQECDEPDWWGIGSEAWLALLTLALVIGTMALAVYTAKLWNEAKDGGRKTLERLEDHHRRDVRAYINIESARICYDPGQKRWESRVIWRNFGKTPAKDVRIFGVLELAQWPIDEMKLKPINKEDPNASRFVLGPTASRMKIDEPYNAGIFDVDFTELRSGDWEVPVKACLVAHGKIFYWDVFAEEERVTDYRYYVGGNEGLRGELPPTRNEPAPGPTYRMVAHSKGNDAT